MTVADPHALLQRLRAIVGEMLTLYRVPFTDLNSREVAVDSWAQQFVDALLVASPQPAGLLQRLRESWEERARKMTANAKNTLVETLIAQYVDATKRCAKELQELDALLVAGGGLPEQLVNTELLEVAKGVLKQFNFIKTVQHNELVRGQTLESASENWNGLGNEYIEFQPLIDAVARAESVIGGGLPSLSREDVADIVVAIARDSSLSDQRDAELSLKIRQLGGGLPEPLDGATRAALTAQRALRPNLGVVRTEDEP